VPDCNSACGDPREYPHRCTGSTADGGQPGAGERHLSGLAAVNIAAWSFSLVFSLVLDTGADAAAARPAPRANRQRAGNRIPGATMSTSMTRRGNFAARGCAAGHGGRIRAAGREGCGRCAGSPERVVVEVAPSVCVP